MDKARYVKVIEGGEVRREDPVEYFPRMLEASLKSQRG